MKKHRFKKIHLACVLALIGIILLVAIHWYKGGYYAGIEEILVTITSPLKGSDTTAIEHGFAQCAPPVIFYFALFLIPVLLWHIGKIGDRLEAKLAGKNKKININKAAENIFLTIGICLVAGGLLYADNHFKASSYFWQRLQQTDIYENYYVDPAHVAITNSGEKKNLILLYLESMETSYASTEAGGGQDVNYIPYLTQLAKEEVNFTEDGLLGGYHNTMGSTWTAGALFSSTAALPYPTGTPAKRLDGAFAPHVTSLYDILDKENYNQYYICGSDAYFGGRSIYYQTHGDLTIYDVNTARTDGYIDEDYHVWWGYEDAKLYSIAKDKLLDAAKQNEPFSFTMLTVDTHFPQGYTCHLCTDRYGTVVENVLACADCQVEDFISWCKEQDFYDDTIIVIAGDHPRMDKVLPKEVSSYERTSYACFVNCEDKTADSRNRIYTQLDMMPTILAAMGYEIEGDRLGLGTNLFSGQQTLAEIMGFKKLNRELAKSSAFVRDLFDTEEPDFSAEE